MDEREARGRLLCMVIAPRDIRQKQPDSDERILPAVPRPTRAAGGKSRNLSALGNGFPLQTLLGGFDIFIGSNDCDDGAEPSGFAD